MRWGVVGGGIFAKTAKTPPLQSALRGYQCATRRATSLQMPAPHMRMRAPPPPYAHTIRPAYLLPTGDPTIFITTRHGKVGKWGWGGQLSARPYSTSPTKSAMANLEN